MQQVVGELAAYQSCPQNSHSFDAVQALRKAGVVVEVVDRHHGISAAAFDANLQAVCPQGQHQIAVIDNFAALQANRVFSSVDGFNLNMGTHGCVQFGGHFFSRLHDQRGRGFVARQRVGQHRFGVKTGVVAA